MSVLFPDEKRKELLAHIHTFAVVCKRWPLREFLCIAGWCNWVFNVFFLLPPGLSALYEKVAGKSNMFAGVAVNAPIVCKLTWLAHHLQHLPGICLFNAHVWKPSDDDVTVAFTDATSTSGLGIFFPDLELEFQCPSSELPTDSHINYLELLVVVSALHICSLKDNVPKCLTAFLLSTSSAHCEPDPLSTISSCLQLTSSSLTALTFGSCMSLVKIMVLWMPSRDFTMRLYKLLYLLRLAQVETSVDLKG